MTTETREQMTKFSIYRAEERHTYPDQITATHWEFAPIASHVWYPIPGFSGAIRDAADTPVAHILAPEGSYLGVSATGEALLVVPGERSGIIARDAYALAKEGYYGLRLEHD